MSFLIAYKNILNIKKTKPTNIIRYSVAVRETADERTVELVASGIVFTAAVDALDPLKLIRGGYGRIVLRHPLNSDATTLASAVLTLSQH